MKNNETTLTTAIWSPEDMLTVTPSPHIKKAERTSTIMLDVIIALVPALVWGIYVFGFRALTITAVAIMSAVLSEYVFQKIVKKPVMIKDYSAALTGILLAFNLPVSVPLWIPLVGSFFAVIVVKQLFGGIGKNFLNPALCARVFLLSWPVEMSVFTAPLDLYSPFKITLDPADVVSVATPLQDSNETVYSAAEMILGLKTGTIGEVSVLMLALGGIYLLVRKIITWQIPAAYIGTVALFAIIMPSNGTIIDSLLYQVCGGGLLLGAIYMATDYVTSPISSNGKLIFGAGCGLITVFIRAFGGYAEGVTFAILIMNSLVFYIDKYTRPKIFGGNNYVKQQKPK